MATYQVFARKYRPRTFADVVGQEHVTRALRQSVAGGRAGHAYIFAGPRGVGKTTTARILAKALNCTDLRDGEPCNACASCTDISAGTALDIHEIDAASYTSVDHIRDLREQAQLVPVRARRKVFILDEAHMLSKNAFNAFLKILEEPPAHVAFILATTESTQLPATVASRCQRFHFRRVSAAEIVTLLRTIAAQEKLAHEEEALCLIARGVDGCVRDAQSALEQAVAFAGGEKLTAAVAGAALGVVPQAVVLDLLAALLADDGPRLLTLLQAADREGHDPVRLAEAAVDAVHAAHLVRLGVPAADLQDVSAEARARLTELFAAVAPARVGRLLDGLLTTVRQMRQQEEYAAVLLEVGLLRAAREALLPSLPELVAAVRAAGGPAAAAAPAAELLPAAAAKSAPARPAPGNPAAATPSPAARPAAGPRPAIPHWWRAVLDAVRVKSRPLHAVLAVATVTGYTDTTLTLSYPPSHPFQVEQTKKHTVLLEQLIAEQGGEKLTVQVSVIGGGAAPVSTPAPAPPPAAAAGPDPLVRQLQDLFGGTVEKVDD